MSVLRSVSRGIAFKSAKSSYPESLICFIGRALVLCRRQGRASGCIRAFMLACSFKVDRNEKRKLWYDPVKVVCRWWKERSSMYALQRKPAANKRVFHDPNGASPKRHPFNRCPPPFRVAANKGASTGSHFLIPFATEIQQSGSMLWSRSPIWFHFLSRRDETTARSRNGPDHSINLLLGHSVVTIFSHSYAEQRLVLVQELSLSSEVWEGPASS